MMEPKKERDSWSDHRVDDLNRKVDEGFKDMREEFRNVRQEFRNVREEFSALRGEMGADRRALVQAGAAMWITSVVGFLGVIATVLTKV